MLQEQPGDPLQGQHGDRINKSAKQQSLVNVTEIKTVFLKYLLAHKLK